MNSTIPQIETALLLWDQFKAENPTEPQNFGYWLQNKHYALRENLREKTDKAVNSIIESGGNEAIELFTKILEAATPAEALEIMSEYRQKLEARKQTSTSGVASEAGQIKRAQYHGNSEAMPYIYPAYEITHFTDNQGNKQTQLRTCIRRNYKGVFYLYPLFYYFPSPSPEAEQFGINQKKKSMQRVIDSWQNSQLEGSPMIDDNQKANTPYIEVTNNFITKPLRNPEQ